MVFVNKKNMPPVFVSHPFEGLDCISERHLVLSTLGISGELPYSKLLYLTGMDARSLDNELKVLVENNDVQVTSSGGSIKNFSNVNVPNSFKLNLSAI